MDSIFSHLPEEEPAPSGLPVPPRLTAAAEVPRGLEEAFNGFTDGIHLWWPDEQTQFGAGTHPEFTDGQLFEEGENGEVALWATIESAATNQLTLQWSRGGAIQAPSRVHISFLAVSEGTRVELSHDGWARGNDGVSQFEAAPDWAGILGRYRRFMGGSQ